MGVGEQATALSEAIHVGCLYTGITIETVRPVIHVIHTYEEDVGFFHLLIQSRNDFRRGFTYYSLATFEKWFGIAPEFAAVGRKNGLARILAEVSAS